MKRLSRLALTSASLLALIWPGTAAAGGWAGLNLSSTGVSMQGGFGLVSLPFLATLGLEASVERPHDAGRPSYSLPSYSLPSYSLGATLRDVRIPATQTELFVGSGLEWRNSPGLYLEGGLRVRLLGPVGLKLLARTSAAGRRAALGAEVRF